jgi:hypothetical protein
MAKEIDKKLLEGLTFSGAKAKKDEKTGKTVWTPFSRPLKPDDIMSVSEDSNIITTKDGKKYDLSKVKGKGSKAGNDPKPDGNPDANPDGKPDGNPGA